MSVIEVGDFKIELDNEGYLVNFEDWNEKVACILADMEGVTKTCPLTEEKMEILKFMREFYKKFNAFPLPSAVCRNIHQPHQCVTEKFLEPVKAWKIAGLPKSTSEVLYNLTRECG